MKRLLYFLPSIWALGFLAFILLILSGPSGDITEYLFGVGILLVFLLSDFLLCRKLWFGCIPGALLGAYVIYYGSHYHGQIFDERLIGASILAYYVVCAFVTIYRKRRQYNNS